MARKKSMSLIEANGDRCRRNHDARSKITHLMNILAERSDMSSVQALENAVQVLTQAVLEEL